MSDPLATYLHDHLGGAKAAIDLLEAMRDGQQEQPLKDFAANLLIEVQADRDTCRFPLITTMVRLIRKMLVDSLIPTIVPA
jgi:hypothetical protein